MCFSTDSFLFSLTTAIFYIVFLITQTSVANYILLLGVPESQKMGTIQMEEHWSITTTVTVVPLLTQMPACCSLYNSKATEIQNSCAMQYCEDIIILENMSYCKSIFSVNFYWRIFEVFC